MSSQSIQMREENGYAWREYVLNPHSVIDRNTNNVDEKCSHNVEDRKKMTGLFEGICIVPTV